MPLPPKSESAEDLLYNNSFLANHIKEHKTITFSFAAAGWLQVYLFGVAHALIENLPGVRIEGLNDSYETYMQERAKKEEDLKKKKEQGNTSNNSNSSTTRKNTTLLGHYLDNRDEIKLRFVGSSAGSLTATGILSGNNFLEMLEYAVECVNDARSSLRRAFQFRRFVEGGVSRFAVNIFKRDNPKGSVEINNNNKQSSPSSPDPAASSPFLGSSPNSPDSGTTTFEIKTPEQEEEEKKTLQKVASAIGPEGGWVGNEFFFPKHLRDQMKERLEIYVTTVPWLQAIAMNDFVSTDDISEALVASCQLSPLAGLPFRLRKTGDLVCDGGMRSYQPRKGEPAVITVSAMYFNASDIHPSVFVPAWWGLYPPPEDKYRQLFALGYNDALKWLWKNGLPQPETEQERQDMMLKYDGKEMPSPTGNWMSYLVDFSVALFFLGILRPIAMLLICGELWFVTIVSFLATVFHEFFPRTFDFLIGTNSLRNRQSGGRKETAKDFWASLSNLMSPRTWLHLAIGYRKVNSKRLGKYSRLYRMLKPFVVKEHDDEDEKKD